MFPPDLEGMILKTALTLFGTYVLTGGPLKHDSKIEVNYLLKRLKQ